jgi:hypothetical protein
LSIAYRGTIFIFIMNDTDKVPEIAIMLNDYQKFALANDLSK